MSKVFNFSFVFTLSIVFCMSYGYASDVTMDLPDSDSTSNSSEENSTDSNVTDENSVDETDDNSLADEYLNGAPEEENTALPEDPLADAYSHEQAVGISTNSSGLSASSIINILLIAVGIIIIFFAIAIIIRLK